MVKVADLGYINRNLEKIPSKEEQKEFDKRRALKNLTSQEPPDRLSTVRFPNVLHEFMGD